MWCERCRKVGVHHISPQLQKVATEPPISRCTAERWAATKRSVSASGAAARVPRSQSSWPRRGSRTVSHTSSASASARHAEHQERQAPAAALGGLAGDARAEPGAETGAEGKDGERHRPARRRELVRQDRGRRRRAAGLADADAEACQQQLQVALGQAAQRRDAGPHRERHGEDIAAVDAIGQHGHRDAHGHVEEPRAPAGEEGHTAIAQVQLLTDRLDQRRDREAVGDVERIDERQQRQHIPAVAWRGRRLRRAGETHLLQVQSRALARQPPPEAPLQARPRTARPLGARVASPPRSARTPFTQTSSTPVASCCGFS